MSKKWQCHSAGTIRWTSVRCCGRKWRKGGTWSATGRQSVSDAVCQTVEPIAGYLPKYMYVPKFHIYAYTSNANRKGSIVDDRQSTAADDQRWRRCRTESESLHCCLPAGVKSLQIGVVVRQWMYHEWMNEWMSEWMNTSIYIAPMRQSPQMMDHD